MLQMWLLSRSSRDDGVIRDGDGHEFDLVAGAPDASCILDHFLFSSLCIPLGWSS